ncbi:MAG: 23S rRNA pseudouridine1911/1915/1917 synthase [Verrucomicrobiales bacterium]|jgi:23S rRNA pseudouridine1911/1915/1917 synthase
MAEEIQEPIILQVVEADSERARLDLFLAARLPEISRSRIQGLIKAGAVRVNQQLLKAKQPVQPGDMIEVEIPATAPLAPQPEEIAIETLHEDDDLIVVNKAPGMVVHPGPGNPSGTLVNALLHHCAGRLSGIGGVERPGIVHRLDKDTSGCLVAAKTDEAHQGLVKAFAGREIRKEYLCVVTGRVHKPKGRIENFIGRNPGNRQKMGIVDERVGKRAITEYEVIGEGSDAAVVRCRIHTGRTHQIRVHMAYEVGNAIIGDPIYGKGTLKRPDATRLMLHAWHLGFTHPVSGKPMDFEASIPDEIVRYSSIADATEPQS